MSHKIIETEQRRHLISFNLDMRDSGYNEKFREGITKRIVEKFGGEVENHRKWEAGEEGGRPSSRTAEERKKQKQLKEADRTPEGWFRKGGFTSTVWMPATPDKELTINVQKALEGVPAPKT